MANNKLEKVASDELVIRVWRGARGCSAFVRAKNERVANVIASSWPSYFPLIASDDYRSVNIRAMKTPSVSQVVSGFTVPLDLQSRQSSIPSSTLIQNILNVLSKNIVDSIRNSVPVVMEMRYRISN